MKMGIFVMTNVFTNPVLIIFFTAVDPVEHSASIYFKKDKLFCHIHLLFQNELEEASENLSQMVARNYLRTPRTKIIQAAHLTKRKRYEFLSAVSKGFLPPDVSSDSPQRRRRTSSSWSYQTWDDDSGDEVRP